MGRSARLIAPPPRGGPLKRFFGAAPRVIASPCGAPLGRRVLGIGFAAAILGAVFAPPAVSAWTRPVPGAVARPFAYVRGTPFAAGQHRGVDLAAAAGDAVRAACSGVVAFAGREDVTLRCGGWRVTHLPLATLSVHAGQHVRAGARLGTLAASTEHRGLHLGVRRAGDPFGYVDPLTLLPGTQRPGPPITRDGPRSRRPAVPEVEPPTSPAPHAPPISAPAHAPAISAPARTPAISIPAHGPATSAPAHAPAISAPARTPATSAPARVRVPGSGAVAPWPVWLGLALLLCGVVGGGITVRVRRQRAPSEPVPSRA